MNMVERVGRAIADTEAMIDADMFHYSYEQRKESYDAIARAAIEEMQEPTDAMMDAAKNATGFYMDMIAAALKEPTR